MHLSRAGVLASFSRSFAIDKIVCFYDVIVCPKVLIWRLFFHSNKKKRYETFYSSGSDCVAGQRTTKF